MERSGSITAVSWVIQRLKRKPDHRACRGGSGKADLPGVPGRAKPAPDWAWPGSGRDSHRGWENEVASGNTEENPVE